MFLSVELHQVSQGVASDNTAKHAIPGDARNALRYAGDWLREGARRAALGLHSWLYYTLPGAKLAS